MRTLMRISMPVDATNTRISDGSMVEFLRKFLADHKPEATYFFTDDDGCRSASIVLDLKNPSDIPGLAEPWFLLCNAKVTFRPVMNAQDFAAAAPAIERAVKDAKKS